jgi:5-oxoprolinase (ATP-hydrolysing)
VLGRIQPRWFPACFGPKADQPLDAAAALARLDALAELVAEETGLVQTVEEVAAGFIRIANENMVKPIKEISVARGYDVQDHALCCFGGAAPQHACAIALALGIRMVLLHPHAGVLSAYGMGLADMIQTSGESVLETLTRETLAQLEPRFAALESAHAETLVDEGFATESIEHVRSFDLRYAGVESSINVVLEAGEDIRAAFKHAHESLHGFTKLGHDIEAVNLRVESIGHTVKPGEPERPVHPRTLSEDDAEDIASVHFDLRDAEGKRTLQKTPTPVFLREKLQPGHSVEGPALIIEDVSTIVVDPGWKATLNARGHLLLEATADLDARERVATECDPVLLEVFNNLFMSVASQMGKTLERVAHSANIKERLDFSCAVFGPDGALIANAPHIPVHLGAMGESVRAILQARGEAMRPGEAYVTNDPYRGGSHLPDVTVVTPVFSEAGECIFFVASRGHHADIGGITPGSMPPFSKSIEEEGVVLHDFLLLSEGRFREEAVVEALQSGPYPARNIPERLSDLRAQVAANVRGAKLLDGLCGAYGVEVVQAYMRHVRTNAAETMRDRIRALPDGVHECTEHLDDGTAIVCRITIDGDEAALDFTGTGAQLAGNLNAPPAVVLSAVLYVFRTLVGARIPLNEGCLDPITVRIPEGTLLRPQYPAAVVGGNVETSQRVCDVVYGALGILAGSQGTMNNFSFGTKDYGYYETICGGAGAGNGFDGASAVHTHMTNTRITDPEVLERRYPVRLREFSIRRGSGGAGQYRGGDGVVRAVEVLAPMAVTLLTERRETRPPGLAGGEPGAAGVNRLIRAGDAEEVLPGHAAIDVRPGDLLIIETPGGGGYGAEE